MVEAISTRDKASHNQMKKADISMINHEVLNLKVFLFESDTISHKNVVRSLRELGLEALYSDNLCQGRVDSLNSPVHLVILGLGNSFEENKHQLAKFRTEFSRSLIIGLSPRVSSSERTFLLNEGLDFIMEKPFFVEELISALRAILRRFP